MAIAIVKDEVHPQGVEGTVESAYTADGKQVAVQDFGKFGKVTVAYDGKLGATDTSFGQYEELKGKQLSATKLQHPLWFLQEPEATYTDISITGEETVNDRPTYIVTFAVAEVYDRTLYVDQETGLTLREKTIQPAETVGQIPVDIHYDDYRKVGGVMMPFVVKSDNPFAGTVEMRYEKAEELTTVPDGMFTIPPRDK